jgi:epoxyqueuosine reductase QueG
MRGSFSHAHAAAAAGLGEIGLNGLFLSNEYGPRVHLGSIITTAKLDPDPAFEGELCDRENCRECLKQCPANAISDDGRLSDVDCLIALDRLSTGYEDTIRKILERQAQEDPLRRADLAIGYSEFTGIGYCGIPCINACPVGKEELR